MTTDEKLKEIRRMLEASVRQKYRQATESQTGDMIGAMEISKETGMAKMAEKVLEHLPQPEDPAVLDYQAMARVKSMDTSLNQYHVRTELDVRRSRALDVVKERMNVVDAGEGRFLFKDPVSSMKFVHHFGEKEADDELLQVCLDNYARQVLEHGIQEPENRS